MNDSDLRRASIVLMVGYFFLTIYSFISLSHIKGLESFLVIKPTFYISYTLLTVGSYIAISNHKYLKCSFFSFLLLDLFILIFVIIGNIKNTASGEQNEILGIVYKILVVILNAVFALSNGLYINGMREIFDKKKNKKMHTYSIVMEYSITGLLLFSTVLSLIDFKDGIGLIISISLLVTLNVIIYFSFFIYHLMIIKQLSNKDADIKENN